ncbi:UDP-N-acetylmuramate dehydrogenase [Pedobacter sp. B4-66]|uniref:UDP-N-acetylmuramate dehydrogenase n=1 Tax=Pedobacter sp. B4-66 TaxID=2817280 RepID=UPI001BD96173|nr:UDP-N-acetylmuramate dehydrogenase [Pedobacter sp. B4-66]
MLDVQKNKSLKPYNTFSIDVDADYFAEILSEQDLKDVLESDLIKQQNLLVLGGGSNVLFTKDFDGLVVKVSIPGISNVVEGNEVIVTAGAGVIWNSLVKYCVQNGYAGIENLSLIPGTVGASPIQNIGAYGVELKDVFKSCTAYEIATSEKRVFNFEDCHFGYRDSVFKNELKGQYIITSVSFRLSTSAKINTQYGAIQEELKNKGIDAPTIEDVSNVVSEIRVAKLPDPSTIGNAGSFFKNPVITKDEFETVKLAHPNVVNYPAPDNKIKLAAGWLIEQCGFKGVVAGQTGTWKNQALVLVNHGGATGAEVYSFSEQIINDVDAKFGVKLEREVNIL